MIFRKSLDHLGLPAAGPVLSLGLVLSIGLAPPVVAREQPLDLGKAVTIGSRAAPRSADDTAVPVDVITAEDIERSGITETSRVLQMLAPSFNFSTSTISDGTDIVRPSTLRGLGPDQVLVLVNGKRRHNSALVHINGSIGRGTSGVDLNAIPVSAIERIEILRDGAAAQYGSDAIAGVINIILHSQAGGRVSVNMGETFEGDGESVTVGFHNGWEFSNGGFLSIAAEARDRDATNRAGRDPRQQYALLPNGDADPREATFDRLNHIYGDAESDNRYFFFNSELPLSTNSTFYASGGIARRDGESAGFYRRALDARNLPEVYPDGFLPRINTDVDDDSITAGFRSHLAGWDMDASVTYGMNSFNFFISNSLNVTFGPTSPTRADAGTMSFEQTTFNLDFKRALDGFGEFPLYVATGLEHRQDAYEIEAGDFVSYANGPDDDPDTAFPTQYGGIAAPGIQVFPGFRPANEVDESRDSRAAYIDLETNLNQRTTVGAALRYEDFDDFGDTLNGKLSARFEANSDFALRGSLSTGFRAPSLHQQYFNNTSTQFVAVGPDLLPLEVGTFRNDSGVARALGVEPLREETSNNYSLGVVYSPSDNFSLTADVYRIDIDDRIVLSGRFSRGNPTIDALLSAFPEVNSVQFFTNAIDTRTHGIDLVASYNHALEAGGDLRLSFAGNWTDTKRVGAVRTPAPLAAEGDAIFDRQEELYLEEGQPDHHFALSADYSNGPWSMLVRFSRYGEITVTESAADTSRDQTFDAKWVTDLEAAYDFGNGLSVALGGNNIFDETPEKNIAANSFNGIFVYPRRAAPFGFNGGYYYARMSYDF